MALGLVRYSVCPPEFLTVCLVPGVPHFTCCQVKGLARDKPVTYVVEASLR